MNTKGLVLVKVLGIRCLYAYPFCSVCRKKVRSIDQPDESLWCLPCNKSYTQSDVNYQYHVNLLVTDGQSIARVTIFGKSLDAFFGTNANAFCRYIMRCERQVALERSSMNNIVHFAMEKCLVGEMVNLSFHMTGTKSSIKESKNILPTPKPTHCNSSREVPVNYLLANGIHRVLANKQKQNSSIFSFLIEYFHNYETVYSLNSSKISPASMQNGKKRKRVNLQEIKKQEPLLPCNLSCSSINGSDFLLSMISSDNEGIDDESTLLPLDISRCSRLVGDDGKEWNCSFSNIKTECATDNQPLLCLSNIWQSFGYAPNASEPFMKTSFRRIHSDCLSEDDGLSTLQESMKEPVVDFKSIFHSHDDSLHMKDLKHPFHNEDTVVSGALNHSEYNRRIFDMFDSPSLEDIDAFIADISASCFTSNSVARPDDKTTLDDVCDIKSHLTSTPCMIKKAIPEAHNVTVANLLCSPICFEKSVKRLSSPRTRDYRNDRESTE